MTTSGEEQADKRIVEHIYEEVPPKDADRIIRIVEGEQRFRRRTAQAEFLWSLTSLIVIILILVGGFLAIVTAARGIHIKYEPIWIDLASAVGGSIITFTAIELSRFLRRSHAPKDDSTGMPHD